VIPSDVTTRSEAEVKIGPDGDIRVPKLRKTDVYTVNAEMKSNTKLTALRLEALPDDALPTKGPGHADGNFVISRVLASVAPPAETKVAGRFLRVEIPGKEKILSLAEVQVFQGNENLALAGEATQSTTAYNGAAKLAIDEIPTEILTPPNPRRTRKPRPIRVGIGSKSRPRRRSRGAVEPHGQ